MLIRTAEPTFLVPGLDSGCAPPDLDSAFVPAELMFVLAVAGLEPFLGVVRLELAGPPVDSDCAPAPVVPALGIFESEPVCAPAGKASSTTEKAIITRLRKCLGEATRHMMS